jgi:hypothetical protein
MPLWLLGTSDVPYFEDKTKYMPRQKLPDELKAAISKMPDKEKDKLLFRLIAKEEALINRLTFELLEGAGSQHRKGCDLRHPGVLLAGLFAARPARH